MPGVVSIEQLKWSCDMGRIQLDSQWGEGFHQVCGFCAVLIPRVANQFP